MDKRYSYLPPGGARPARTFGDLRRDRGGLARFSLSFYNVLHVMFQQFMEDV